MIGTLTGLIASYPFLPPLLILSGFISYEDYREGKIRNRYIAVLIIGGLIYQLALTEMVLPVLKTFLYGLGISFMLYFLGIWPAGDAKLFSALLLYFPDTFFRHNLVMNYSINVFVPIFLLMGVVVFLRSGKTRLKEAIGFSLDPYRVFSLAVILLGFVGFAMDGLRMFGIQGGFFLTVLLLFVAFELFHFFLSKWTELFFTLVAALRIIVNFGEVFSIRYMSRFVSIIVLFIFLRFFMLYLTYYYFSRDVEVNELEPGMSVAEGIVDYGTYYGKISFLNASLINYMMQRKENFIHDLVFLTKEDVEKIKELKKDEKLGFESLRVDEKQQFALLIFLGYFMTLFLQNSFIYVIKTILY